MERKDIIHLIEHGRPDLAEAMLINNAGYAGVTSQGTIVDRRIYPDAIAVPANPSLGIPPPKELPPLQPFDIWMEGFVVTGNSSIAHKLNDEPIMAYSFDHAVKQYMDLREDHGVSVNTRLKYLTVEAYLDRDSNYNIWACDLYPTEEQARRAFG